MNILSYIALGFAIFIAGSMMPSMLNLKVVKFSLKRELKSAFYFTAVSFLIVENYFEYSFINSVYFSVGSMLGSFFLYSMYAIKAKKIENRISFLATKMDLILGCLTGIIAIGNTVYLFNQ